MTTGDSERAAPICIHFASHLHRTRACRAHTSQSSSCGGGEALSFGEGWGELAGRALPGPPGGVSAQGRPSFPWGSFSLLSQELRVRTKWPCGLISDRVTGFSVAPAAPRPQGLWKGAATVLGLNAPWKCLHPDPVGDRRLSGPFLRRARPGRPQSLSERPGTHPRGSEAWTCSRFRCACGTPGLV